VLDFTSALYLGLVHEHASLRPWHQLTTGKPAVLSTMPGVRALAADLALLAGCEAATLAPSTLHLFIDVFRIWGCRSTTVFIDSALYQIGLWGVERATGLGMPAHRFSHHDPGSLARSLRRDMRRTPVIVTDGYCPCCGEPAPIPAYLDCLGGQRGWMVIDDTQALGVLGRAPCTRVPLGLGGGGIMQWFGIRDPRIVLISSLAKAFGVPMAFLAGTRSLVDRFEQVSETRVHCSPISAPALHAAEQAIAFNEHEGDRARGTLMQSILRLQRKLQASPLRLRGGAFPLQSLSSVPYLTAEEIHRRLDASEIQTVLQKARTSGPRIAFLLTARHTLHDIDRLGAALLAMSEPSLRIKRHA